MRPNPVIGIIGGTGLMGTLFREFFERYGHKVLIAGSKTSLTPEDCARQADVVVISVPMSRTVEIIRRIGPLVKPSGLLFDLTSLKLEPLAAMLESSQCSVVGTHPMFGPGVKSFRNQTIVICPGRGEEWRKWLKELFLREGAKLKETDARNHDRMMAVIQGLIHFTTITMGYVLKELGIDIRESLEFSSPIYKLRMDMVGRILNQDPDLYASIEIMNPEIPGVLQAYIEASRKLYDLVESRNWEGFKAFFEKAAAHLGDFRQEAEKYSNYLIRQLVKLGDELE